MSGGDVDGTGAYHPTGGGFDPKRAPLMGTGGELKGAQSSKSVSAAQAQAADIFTNSPEGFVSNNIGAAANEVGAITGFPTPAAKAESGDTEGEETAAKQQQNSQNTLEGARKEFEAHRADIIADAQALSKNEEEQPAEGEQGGGQSGTGQQSTGQESSEREPSDEGSGEGGGEGE